MSKKKKVQGKGKPTPKRKPAKPLSEIPKDEFPKDGIPQVKVKDDKQPQRIRLGWMSDAANAGTGFGNVAKNVLGGLHATGKYDIYHLALGYDVPVALKTCRDEYHTAREIAQNKDTDEETRTKAMRQLLFWSDAMTALLDNAGQTPQEDQWKIPLPSTLPYKLFPIVGSRFGEHCLLRFCEFHKLDVLVLNLDPWMTAWTTIIKEKPCPFIYYQPLDTTCHNERMASHFMRVGNEIKELPWSAILSLQNYTVLYGEWAKGIVDKNVQYLIDKLGKKQIVELPANFRIIRHGVDPNVFYPIPKKQAREALNIPQDLFIIGMVAGNQRRKDWPSFCEATTEFSRRYPKKIGVLPWTTLRPTKGGEMFDIPKMYMDMDADIELIKVGDDEFRWKEQFVNLVYNAMDVHLLLHHGEGCGLPHLEASVVGIPSFGVDATGLKDYFADERQKIKVDRYEVYPGGNHLRPTGSIEDILEKIEWVYNEPEEAGEFGRKCREVVLNWTWQSTIPQWEEVINEAVEEKRRNAKDESDYCDPGYKPVEDNREVIEATHKASKLPEPPHIG